MAPDVSLSDELLMNIQHFRRSSSPQLPDTVTKLECGDGCKVYLVGTAHFSKESQDDVEKVCFHSLVNCSYLCPVSFVTLFLSPLFLSPLFILE